MAIIGKVQNFNRIISLTFYKGNARQLVIRCPTKGIKPDIEITASYGIDIELKPFDIVVKNLYMNLSGEQYTKLKVRAGYENNSVEFMATIQNIIPEQPGPEGRTIIRCELGEMTNWLGSYVQLNFDPGTPITTVLANIAAKLKCGIHCGDYAKSLKLGVRFEHDGTARGAMDKLATLFDEQGLQVYVTNNVLCAICATKGDYVITRRLKYMSAPPQKSAGDERGTYYTTITAPWDPSISIGDRLIIPAKEYMRNFSNVSSFVETQVIQVRSLKFHFGTKGASNQMTLQGFLIG